MTRFSRRELSRALLAAAVRIAPARRAPLAQGMLAELDHVGDSDALGFAAGALWSAAGWRLASAQGVTGATRALVTLGAGALSAMGMASAWRVLGADASHAAWALFALSGFYLCMAVLAATRGLASVAALAGLGLALNTAMVVGYGLAAPGPAGQDAFLRALAIEAYGLLTMLALIALGAQALAARLTPRR